MIASRDAPMRAMHVALVGFGTVGRGTWDVLRRNEEEITRRAGRPIRITWIGTRSLERARQGMRGMTGVQISDDPGAVVRHADVDIVCELIGGIEPARSRSMATRSSPPRTRRA